MRYDPLIHARAWPNDTISFAFISNRTRNMRMGMQSSWGAEDTANEILAIIRKKINEHRNARRTVRVLREIEEAVERIRVEAEGGWR